SGGGKPRGRLFGGGRPQAVELGEGAEAVPDLAHLRLAVLHILVRARRIPQARELGVLVDRHTRAATSDVVGDLVPGLHRAPGGAGQLVRRRRRASAGADLLAIELDRLLERFGPCEGPQLDPVRREVAEPAVDDRAKLGAAPEDQAAHDLADDLALEGLEPARTERRALEAQAPEAVEERVGLHLVAEHRREPAVELELDAVR